MVDWIHDVSLTRALGIPISPESGSMLEEGQGGDVLTLFPLKMMDSRYGGFTREDYLDPGSGRPIYLPVIFTARAVDSPAPYGLTEKYDTFQQAAEQWHGHQWRYWPSWIGEYEEPSYDFYVYPGSGEHVDVLRGWSGIPLETLDLDVVESLMKIAGQRVSDSCWPEVVDYEEMARNGDVDYYKVLDVMDLDRNDSLETAFPEDYDREAASTWLNLHEHLVAKNLVCDPRIWEDYSRDHFAAQVGRGPLPPVPPEMEAVVDLSFAPMLDLLLDGTPERELWRRLHNRARDGARLSSRLVPMSEQPNFDYREGLYDPCHYYSSPVLPPGRSLL